MDGDWTRDVREAANCPNAGRAAARCKEKKLSDDTSQSVAC